MPEKIYRQVYLQEYYLGLSSDFTKVKDVTHHFHWNETFFRFN